MKTCSKCKIEKLEDEFYKNKKSKTGLTSACKLCLRLSVSEYQKTDKGKETSKRARQKFQKTQKGKDLNSKHTKKFRKTEKGKEAVKKNCKKYYEKNKSLFRFHSKFYKISKTKATPRWLSEDQIVEMKEIYKLRETLTNETGILHHVDHIVPLRGETVCGLHVPWNLRVIPATENLSKRNKLIGEYNTP